MASDVLSSETVAEVETKPALAIPIASPEFVAAVLWMVAADIWIFRSGTFVAIAVFLWCVPAILRLATTNTARPIAMSVCLGLAAVVAARLVWLGSALTVISAIVVIVAMAMAARGMPPLVLEGFAWAIRSFVDGARRAKRYRWSSGALDRVRSHHHIAAVLLPVVAAVVFGTLFILANPDWVDWSGQYLRQIADRIAIWIDGLSVWEIPFCVVALLSGIGLIRPTLARKRIGGSSRMAPVQMMEASTLYPAYRNTLMTLVVLFAAYLGFEFWTLWTRDFPTGFYYAGYAHQGAAWLTVALILATVSLSIIFSRSLRRDPRINRVRRWAWAWSGLNFLLVIAVLHRLSIYVGYNGLTRMRIIGYFGVVLVAVGFAMVVYKIARDRTFWWLLRSQLAAFVIAGVIYSVTPVDWIAHRYNVARVQSGDLAPSVMIAVKPIDDEGMLTLLPLINHENDVIAQGVRARLTIRQSQLSNLHQRRWTEFQGASSLLQRQTSGREPSMPLQSKLEQVRALNRFEEYAMQWY